MKVVIPAAGLGTRFLPATKSQPKEMLPVIDRPIIQYVVEEAIAAGSDDILIVTGRGKRAIEDHFDHSPELDGVGDRPEIGHIAELGGGNSAVLSAFRARFPGVRLSAIDSNVLGLRLLEAQTPGAGLTAIEADVLAPVADALGADLVFSVGLVEHFSAEDTTRAIAAHFAHVKPGGLVLITFPTPTWLYRIARGLAEAAGVWAFPDERPLAMAEVTREMARHGEVLGARINWLIILTQGVVVARRLQI